MIIKIRTNCFESVMKNIFMLPKEFGTYFYTYIFIFNLYNSKLYNI